MESNPAAVFASAICVDNRVMNSAPLWIIAGLSTLLFIVVVELGRCADLASFAQLRAFAVSHADLLYANNPQSPAAPKQQLTKRRLGSWCSARFQRCGVFAMNASFSSCRGRRRGCCCPAAAGNPVVYSLAYLPNAYTSALYERFLGMVAAGKPSPSPDNNAMLAALEPGEVGLYRESSPPCEPAVVAAAARDISKAMHTKGFFSRVWRLRRTMMHVWSIQVSSVMVVRPTLL